MTRELTFPNAQFDAVDNSRKTLAQVFGGAAIILTFAWSFSKDSETLEQARQQTANQQYLSSAQMLSDSNAVATRSAGIFSMGKVASVRTEYHMPVRDALAAFLSTRSALMLRERMDRPTRVEADVQAAIEVLGRRDRRNDDRSRMLNLEQNYLVGANFYRLNGFQGVSFQRAFLPGANFRYADLSEARFDGASMSDWQGYGPQAWRNEIASEYQLLSREMLRDYVKCVVRIRYNEEGVGLNIEVDYEYVIANFGGEQQRVEIIYLIENRIKRRGALKAIEYKDLSAKGSQKWSASGTQLGAFKEIGAFGEKYTVMVDVASGHKLWARTKSVEYHEETTELFLVCYQPALDFVADVCIQKSALEKVEFSAEMLHPRISAERSPQAVREDGEWAIFSYQIGYPCLPYQGIKIFTQSKSR